MDKLNNNDAPIGVFDSGLGGLTVVKQLIKQLPNESIVYYGDTARVPYGTKSKESIIRFSRENADVLIREDVKMIVVACNSSSSYAMSVLRREFDVPIIDVIVPGAKKAVEVTKNGKIGVIATSATVASKSYEKAIRQYDVNVEVFSQACPLFVPIIEEGWSKKKVAYDVAEEYLRGLKKNKVDAIILGCTHYPLLKQVLKKVVGPKVRLIDSAKEIALVVRKELIAEGIQKSSVKKIKHRFIISDKPQEFKAVAKRFLGFDIGNIVMGYSEDR